MRICLDIDGVICHLRQPHQKYSELAPLPGAIEKIQALKATGHYIILMTARHMKTCGGNTGLVIAKQGKTLMDWLAHHAIPYDEIWFGKPQADVYIDDNGFRFTSWEHITSDGSSLPKNKESTLANAQPCLETL